MDAARIGTRRVQIPFEVWKLQLRNDCKHEGKLRAFNTLTDHVLQLFWKRGIEPSVKAIVNDRGERD